MWKVRKVLFLGVVMEEGKVEIEEDKVEGVLKWLTPQCIVMPELKIPSNGGTRGHMACY